MQTKAATILNLALFLCTDERDIEDLPERPRVRNTKRGPRLVMQDAPAFHPVALRMGAALDLARARAKQEPSGGEGGGRRVAPHVRRAHWHTYRYGPGRAQRKLKWLPPIPVNLEDLKDQELPAVVREVEIDEAWDTGPSP